MRTRFSLSILTLLASLWCTSPTAFAQQTTGHPAPDWLLADWAEKTAGSGIWITDNSEFRSEQEPFDAYGLQWEYGLGDRSLFGRLYCLREGEEVRTAWQFLIYWDPAAAVARVVQIGSDGTVGQGTIYRLDDGRIEERQLFVSPQGGSFESGHRAWTDEGAHHTRSYSIDDGEWTARRYYIWRPQ